MLGMAKVVPRVANLCFDLRRRNSWRTWGSKRYRKRKKKKLLIPKGRMRGTGREGC